MKITIFKEYSVDMNYRDEYDVEIDDEEYQLIQNGEHPDYESLDDWASEQDLDDLDTIRSESWPGDYVVEEGTGVTV
jgi:hypothetical protein